MLIFEVDPTVWERTKRSFTTYLNMEITTTVRIVKKGMQFTTNKLTEKFY
jgi:hypothetical protein